MMFGLFKKKHEKPAFDPERMQKVVQDFGAVIEEIDATSFYDVSRLPHDKDEILNSVLIAISINTDPVLQNSLEIVLMCLPRFQKGVGPESISSLPIDPAALLKAHEAGEISVKEIASKWIDARSGVDQEKLEMLRQKSEQETQKYLELIKQVKGS